MPNTQQIKPYGAYAEAAFRVCEAATTVSDDNDISKRAFIQTVVQTHRNAIHTFGSDAQRARRFMFAMITPILVGSIPTDSMSVLDISLRTLECVASYVYNNTNEAVFWTEMVGIYTTGPAA